MRYVFQSNIFAEKGFISCVTVTINVVSSYGVGSPPHPSQRG